MKDEIKR